MSFDPIKIKSFDTANWQNMSNTSWTMPSWLNFEMPVFMTNFTLPSFWGFNNNFNFDNFSLWGNNFNFNFKFDQPDSSVWNFSKMKFTVPSAPKVKTTYSRSVSGAVNNGYSTLSQSAAYQKALSDTNLERLSGGKNWEVAESSFITDIPFAKKGTGAILDKVGSIIGEKLVITSALGTGEANNPHAKGGYASHHNAENPKLDIRINGNGQELAQKLRNTGYFSRVSIESDHLDVQIDPEKFKSFEAVA